MKLLSIFFLMIGLLSPQLVFSGGYYCEAFCVSLSTDTSTLYLVDHINIEAGVTKRRDAHQLLRQMCRTFSSNLGYTNPAILLDELKYSSSYKKESESSSSSSSQSSRDASASGTIKPEMSGAQLRGKNALLNNYQIHLSASAKKSISLSNEFTNYQYDKESEERGLSIEIAYSDKDVACEYDEDIVKGNIPYTGKIKVQ